MRQQEAAREAEGGNAEGAQVLVDRVCGTRPATPHNSSHRIDGVLPSCVVAAAQVFAAQTSAEAAQAAAEAAKAREAGIRAGIQRVLAARSRTSSAPAVALSLLHDTGGQMSLDELKAAVSDQRCTWDIIAGA